MNRKKKKSHWHITLNINWPSNNKINNWHVTLFNFYFMMWWYWLLKTFIRFSFLYRKKIVQTNQEWIRNLNLLEFFFTFHDIDVHKLTMSKSTENWLCVNLECDQFLLLVCGSDDWSTFSFTWHIMVTWNWNLTEKEYYVPHTTTHTHTF